MLLAYGGYAQLTADLGVAYQTASAWVSGAGRKFPAPYYEQMIRRLRERGYDAPRTLWAAPSRTAAPAGHNDHEVTR